MSDKDGPRGYAGAHQPVLGTSVHLIDATGEGKNENHLFGIKGDCWSPTLSPDGKRVAFSSTVNGKGQIYLVNADTDAYSADYWNAAIGHSRTFPFKDNAVNISRNDHCDRSPV